MTKTIWFGDHDLTIEEIGDIANRKCKVGLSQQPDVRERIVHSAAMVGRALKDGRVIYGVTTGYGDSCETAIAPELIAELPLHLSRYHGCGTGRFLTAEETRSVMVVRLSSLLRGWSGVSLELVQLLTDMISLDILPLIPAEGSVGASGDLTPLSYIAGALAGERRVRFNDEEMDAATAFARTGLRPIKLGPKEALAIMNGTAVMTGLAVIAFQRAEFISHLSSRLTAMTTLALRGNCDHFDMRLASAKPHPGQMAVTARIRADLAAYATASETGRLQDRYSVRCAPHVIGVLEDLLPTFRRLIEVEISSANDNPLFDPDDGRVLHGGHFYGGHIAFAMDGLKTLVANVADLLDRQLALLVDTRYSNGLPPNLSGSTGPRAAINHGLKAVQIGVSAWTAEALKLTMPASVFSRSTECHNQDKVSMGTIAARDALRIIELTEQVVAGHLIACVQALRLRMRTGDLTKAAIGAPIERFLGAIEDFIPFIQEDRALDVVLTSLCARIATRAVAMGGN
jgi:histidine ammonia-lyase